jgi:hypothetical protein
MISWLRRKQPSMELNTSEAGYITTSVAIHEGVWLQKLLAGIFDLELEPTLIHCDNKSCVKLIENPVFHDRSKHTKIKYHYIRDIVQRGAVEIQYISTDEKIEDILTKPLSRVKYEYFRGKLDMMLNIHSLRGRCVVSSHAG